MSSNDNRLHADPRAAPTVVADERVHVRPDDARDPGIDAAQRRYGGIDVPGTLVGMLAALALLILLGGLIGAAVGAVGYQTGLKGNHASLSIAGLVGGVITLFIAYLVGGWTAGRIARYDGTRNGLMTGVWTLLLAAVLAGLGALLNTRYDVFGSVPNLPNWFSRDALTLGAIASAAAAVCAMLLGGLIGGRIGARYHQRIDRLIASTRSGGIAPTTAGGQIVKPL
jgi:hypothetical protein